MSTGNHFTDAIVALDYDPAAWCEEHLTNRTDCGCAILDTAAKSNEDQPPEKGSTKTAPTAHQARLDIATASNIKVQRVTYLWKGRIPRGAMTLLPGEEGIGKTTIGARLIADITLGTLLGEDYGTPRDVIVTATEDGLADVSIPRLQQAGADLKRVHIIRATFDTDGDGRAIIIPNDLPAIADAVRQFDASLVWIDSLVTTLPDAMKSISYKDTAKVMKALGAMAEAAHCSVVAPWHLNKSAGSDTAHRIMDSRAFRTGVRSMLLVVPDPDAPEGVTQGIVALDKANAGTLHVPALRYRIDSSEYTVNETDRNGRTQQIAATCGVATWIGEVEGSGRDAARAALAPAVEQAGTARHWLHDYLTTEGESPRQDVLDAGMEAKFSRAAIERAGAALPVVSVVKGTRDPKTGRPSRRAVWALPDKDKGDSRDDDSPVTPPAHDTDGTEGTEGTGESSSEVIDVKGAGQAQSPQSPQSPQSHQGHAGDVTGAPREQDTFPELTTPRPQPAPDDPSTCPCGNPLHKLYINAGRRACPGHDHLLAQEQTA